MGGCCFTPKKTQLLWWYWLLLFSIVGIPMFVAALYIRQAARYGVIEPWQVRQASRMFWWGVCVSLFLTVSFFLLVIDEIRPPPGAVGSPGDAFWFIVSFLFWLVVAVGAAKLSEKVKLPYIRAAIVACCALLPAIFTFLPYWRLRASYSIGLLPLGLMKFLVCMLPAHYWYRFTVSPSPRRAWLFLGTLAIGTALFWVVSQYGEAAHINLRHWLNPTMARY